MIFIFKMIPRSSLWCVLLLCGGLAGFAQATSETQADRTLRQIVERQKMLLTEAAKESPTFDELNFKTQVEQICQSYETLLRANPTMAEGYAAYGYLLMKTGMRREAIAILLKANQLNKELPLVKNQIGNFLAEEGRTLDALPYFLSAIELSPDEPLYHYQLGTLLYEAREDFLKSGEWTRQAIDRSMHDAFRKAAELAPENFSFTYRYAESFYDLETPQWDEALAAWKTVEKKATLPFDQQTVRLHQANVLIHQKKFIEAQLLMTTVTDEKLGPQKQKLVAQLPVDVKR